MIVIGHEKEFAEELRMLVLNATAANISYDSIIIVIEDRLTKLKAAIKTNT